MARVLLPLIRLICLAFFDEKYLSGRHFVGSRRGYVYALRSIWQRNILRLAPPLPWPASSRCHVSDSSKIFFDPNDINNFQSPGTYYQSSNACIYLGRGVYIGPNVGLITANHDVNNLDEYVSSEDISLGECSWIGMNSVVLPGVTLGAKTIVAAGSVVTKSFPEGGVVLAGSPAKIIKRLDSNDVKGEK